MFVPETVESRKNRWERVYLWNDYFRRGNVIEKREVDTRNVNKKLKYANEFMENT